jgi:hypothetical protein
MTHPTAPASFGFAAAGIFAFAPQIRELREGRDACDTGPAARLAALGEALKVSDGCGNVPRPPASAAEIFNAARSGAAPRIARA